MKTAIVYASKYGSTRKVVGLMCEGLTGDCDIVDLERAGVPDFESVGTVVIGGPVYGGKMHRRVVSFCRRHRGMLERKSVALFATCLYRGQRAEAQFLDVYPGWLHAHSFARSVLGGELHMARLNSVDRILVAGLNPGQNGGAALDVERLDIESMDSLCKAINKVNERGA